jgi:hypothetical protein
MPPWTPAFGSYHSWLEDKSIMSVTVDQAAVAGIGRDHPVVFNVMFDMQSPSADGLVSSEERSAITALEEAIETALARYGEPWLVGWRTERGKRYLWLYLPADAEHARLDGNWADNYKLHWDVALDPQWQAYHERLAPTPFQEQLIHNNRQLHERGLLGDDPTIKRVVDHTALFQDHASAAAGAKALRKAGFIIVDISGEVVCCTRKHDLQVTTLEQALHVCLDAIEPDGGTYDGWGALVLSERDRPPKGRRKLFRR